MAVLRRLSVVGALLALFFTLVGTTGCVGSGSSGPVAPPSGGATAAPITLTYRTSPAVYTKGTAITANVPASTGGAITAYSVAPALPAGLTLSATSGQVTGTPTVVAPVATFTIVGSNGLGTATCLLSITVNDAAPASLVYPNPVLALRRGTAVSAQIPTTTGGTPATYTVAPALPAGLVLNATTGVLTGTPTAVSGTANFTITAANATGNTSCQIAIGVVDVAPLNLAYPNSTLTLYRAVPLAAQTPTNTGGPITTYGVAPALPAGLTLSAATGVLSGTPTTLQGATTHVVTGTNSGGTATAQLGISVLDPAPVISTQPTAAAAAVGGSTTFTVAAQGVTTLSYQWRKDGTALTSGGNIAGATSASLALSAITAGDAGSYSVVVSNTVGGVTFTATSSAAALTVTPPPTISTQPASLTITQAQNASFTVAASGTGTLSYQWRKGSTNLANGGNISGATSATLTLTSAALADAGTYTVVVTNTQNAVASNVTSSAATLTVNPFPASSLLVSGFPNPTTPGVSHPFTVTARDIANATTIGYRGTVHFTSTDPLAVLPADYQFAAADAGVHSFAATFGTEGTQSITATDTVTASITGVQTGITVTSQPPTILTQPQTQTVVPPDAVTFTVSARANNGGSLTYAWKKNGTAIPGETGASTMVAATEFATNTDAYTVTVSEGSLSTDSATVYAQAAVTAPTYAGDPLPVPSRPLTVLPSLHVDSVLFPNGAFRLGYDETLKNPVWTAYLNFPVTSPYANSTIDYTTDLRLQAPQVGRDDYTGIYTGGANVPNSYDRGHQVPRADVSYRYKTVAGDDATIMSNLVPQISQFNQQTWQKLEDLIGGTSGGATNGLTSFKGRVWVYTGSYFPASPTWWNSTITAGLRIAIPEACYKIVVHESTPGHPEVLAVLMPNAWGLVNSNTTVGAYVTSVARIEALTGINFFPNLATVAPGLDIPTWKATVDVRGWRTPFEQTTGPNVHMVQPSYDSTIELGTEVTFSGAATPNATAATGTTIASTTWNFGDATPTTTGLSTTHLYTGAGTYSVSFSANDSLGSSNTLTRVIRVVPSASSNTAPVTTPATLADKVTLVDQAVTVTFAVSDDRTAAGSLVVTAVSDNTVLLPASGITVTNLSGAVELALAAATGQTGSANITVTVTDGDGAITTRTFLLTVNAPVANTLTEGFETGTKASYTLGNVTLASGSWALNDALIGNTTSDRKTGNQSIRVRNGKVTMNFDYAFGAKTVTVNHAKYGTDANSIWGLWYSTDAGTNWISAGNTVTSSSTTLAAATFTINVTGNIRFEFRKTDGLTTRFNLDDFQINGY